MDEVVEGEITDTPREIFIEKYRAWHALIGDRQVNSLRSAAWGEYILARNEYLRLGPIYVDDRVFLAETN